MPRIENIVVDVTRSRERLDRFLASRLEGVSRSAIQRLLESGGVSVNGEPATCTQVPRAGDEIRVVWPEVRPLEVLPQAIPLEILHEDDDLLVINKAAEHVVHPSFGHEDGTIVNAVLHHCRGRLSGIGGVARPGIVHRLDLGTSGCLVVAKNDPAHVKLTELFGNREVEKLYQCIVCGDVHPPSGEIRAGIARHPTHRKRMAVLEGTKGRPARTTYRLLERLREASFVEATLHTGRTHQIRVHFQFLGFPLLGDAAYGKRPTARVTERTGFVAERQMLHARMLAFHHPRTGRFMEFNAPLPSDFKHALDVLRLTVGGH